MTVFAEVEDFVSTDLIAVQYFHEVKSEEHGGRLGAAMRAAILRAARPPSRSTAAAAGRADRGGCRSFPAGTVMRIMDKQVDFDVEMMESVDGTPEERP